MPDDLKQPLSPDASLEEQLVAYLDGELDSEASRRIEELLAADPKVRQALQEMDRAWQLLGELDTAPVDDRFTRSTLEMVALAAVAEVEKCRAEAPRRRRRQWFLAGAGLAAAAAAGFLGVVLLRPDPNKRLIQELPVLENLDQYCQINDYEFLRMLYDERVFAEEPNDGQ